MPGLMYTASSLGDVITAADDILQCNPVGTDKPIIIHQLNCIQSLLSQDANEDILRIGIYRGVTGTPAGAGLSENALDSNNTEAAGATWLGTITTNTTVGVLIGLMGWNIRQTGPVYLPTPEARPRIAAPDDPVVFRLLDAPDASITASFEVIWEE